VVMPRSTTIIRPDDHVFIAMHTRLKPLIDNLFGPDSSPPQLPHGLELSFRADLTAEQLHWFFNLPSPSWPPKPLHILLKTDNQNDTTHLGPFEISLGEEPDFVTLRVA
jgi:potassium/hydrogen antiporter